MPGNVRAQPMPMIFVFIPIPSHSGGRVGIAPGAITASIMCTFLQLAYNELGIMRLKFISDQLQKGENALDIPTPLPVAPEQPVVVVVPQEPLKPMSERVFGWFGFEKVSDEDYLAKLKAERDVHLKKIAELEREQAEGGGTSD